MASNPSDQPASDLSSPLSRSVNEATERIHEIIDAAEKVASEIRTEAEVEAQTYLAERRREADRLAQERSGSLDRLTKTLADTAEQFKHQAERLLGDLDQAITDARAGVYRHGAIAALGDEPAEAPQSEPASDSTTFSSASFAADRDPLTPDRDPFEPLSRDLPTRKPVGLEPLSPLDADENPIELPPLASEPVERERPAAAVAAYPGRADRSAADETPAPSGDQTSEALLRATQLAVTGKDRDEIADVLRADFPGVDTEPLLDEILD